MPGSSYRLYARKGAGSLAPQMLLEETGAPYELVWVSKAPAEIEAFRRISRAAKIPVLVLADGTVVSESAAILIHLTNAHPAAALAPVTGSSAHALFLQWMVFLSANAYEAALRFFYADRYSAAGEGAAAQIKTQALADWSSHFDTVHAALSPYVLGAELSAADHYLYMLASWYPLDDSALASRLPKLRQHAELVRRRPATRKAEQDHSDS
ncbi:MAG: glutathione S-transferase family protein [Steroidobacterales bacterium]